MSEIYHTVSDPDFEKYPVLALHGLFGTGDNLSALKRELQANFNVISADLPDHGRSYRSKAFSFEGYANQLIELLTSLDIRQLHIVGHSLGGKIAMQIALSAPTLVNKLIIADIAPVAYTPRHQNVFAGLRAVDLQQISGRQQAADQMSQYIQEAGVRQFLLKSLFQTDGNWQWRFNLDLLERDYNKISAAISSNQPFEGDVLFLKGENSDYLLADHRPTIARLFPNSQAKVIQGTGHWLHAEKPNIFNRLVKTFLQA